MICEECKHRDEPNCKKKQEWLMLTQRYCEQYEYLFYPKYNKKK